MDDRFDGLMEMDEPKTLRNVFKCKETWSPFEKLIKPRSDHNSIELFMLLVDCILHMTCHDIDEYTGTNVKILLVKDSPD